MLFFITMKRVAYVLNTVKLKLPAKSTETQNKDCKYWIEDNFPYKNFILTSLYDELHNYYNSDKTVKEIWNAFQKKYDIEKVGAKKYAFN